MPGTPQTHAIAYCLWLPFPRVILQNCFTRQRNNRTLTVATSLLQAFVPQRGRHTQLPARGREGKKVRTLFHRYVCLVRGAYTTVCYCHFCCHCDKKMYSSGHNAQNTAHLHQTTRGVDKPIHPRSSNPKAQTRGMQAMRNQIDELKEMVARLTAQTFHRSVSRNVILLFQARSHSHPIYLTSFLHSGRRCNRRQARRGGRRTADEAETDGWPSRRTA